MNNYTNTNILLVITLIVIYLSRYECFPVKSKDIRHNNNKEQITAVDNPQEDLNGQEQQNLVANVQQDRNSRNGKSLQFYLDPSGGAFGSNSDQEPFLLDLDEQLEAALAAQMSDGQQDNEILSRARPGRPKPHHSSTDGYPNSPIYYIRLPPTPYMYVPGMGYVSQPPTLRPPPVQAATDSPFINLPLHFISNAKPTGIYTWNPPTERPQQQIFHQSRPRPKPTQTLQDSTITNLDKGPYSFNGRPTDIFLLRNTYNSLYADALQNFYP